MALFNSLTDFFQALHFIRPAWFFAFIPLLLLILLQFRNQKLSRSWQSVIDPRLLPHLLVEQTSRQSSRSGLLIFIVGLLVIISLAGPAWEKRPQPVFKEQSALVIALDLSRSMDAGDIKPSRLTRARHKIIDILKRRKLGQTALLVYAATAYTVTPLTDDVATITALLPSLTTDLMPSQGSRTDMAIKIAQQLLANAAVKHGDILLVTDAVEPGALSAIKQAAQKHRISILAIATRDGAPIPQQYGGFVKDNRGAIVIPKLDISELQKAVQSGKGYLSLISPDDADINTLSSLFNNNRFESKKSGKKSDLKTDSWYEQGAWLLLLVIPLSLLFFRRGILFALVFIVVQPPQPANAGNLWDALWFNADQRAEKLLRENKPQQAAELFKDKRWKSSAYYKNKQYQKSITELEGINTADAHYNRGNAFAMSGDIEKAIEEYDAALKLQPDHEDAAYNKNLLIKKQSQQNKQSSSKDNQNSSQQDNNSQSSQSDNTQSKNNNSKLSERSQNNSASNSKNVPGKDKAENDPELARENRSDKKGTDKKNSPAKKPAESGEDKEQKQTQQITRQWLRQITDDPGGLLRNKFKYQYQRQDNNAPENKKW